MKRSCSLDTQYVRRLRGFEFPDAAFLERSFDRPIEIMKHAEID